MDIIYFCGFGFFLVMMFLLFKFSPKVERVSKKVKGFIRETSFSPARSVRSSGMAMTKNGFEPTFSSGTIAATYSVVIDTDPENFVVTGGFAQKLFKEFDKGDIVEVIFDEIYDVYYKNGEETKREFTGRELTEVNLIEKASRTSGQ